MHRHERRIENKHFILKNGKEIHTIKQLYKELKFMPENEFILHLEHQDFAAWVEHVFFEKELAKQIRTCHDRKTFRKTLKTWINEVKRDTHPEKESWFKNPNHEYVVDIICFVLGGIVGSLITLMFMGFP